MATGARLMQGGFRVAEEDRLAVVAMVSDVIGNAPEQDASDADPGMQPSSPRRSGKKTGLSP